MYIKRTKLADTDLIDLFVYGAQQFGLSKAEAYFLDIENVLQFLAKNPFVGNERDEFKPPVHIHPHKKHLIIYTIETDFIQIVRVLHHRMDVKSHLQ
jgi:toxin ParE1/3/4